jgi:hypothetical protein
MFSGHFAPVFPTAAPENFKPLCGMLKSTGFLLISVHGMFDTHHCFANLVDPSELLFNRGVRPSNSVQL